jgi:hypothetical protein
MLRAAISVVALAACGFPHGAGIDGGTSAQDTGDATDAIGTDSDGSMQPGPRVRLLDLDDTRITGGQHANFPLLVQITAPWLETVANGGSVARADGFDIFFSADQAGTAKLPHEVELYAPDSGNLIAWVLVPALLPTTVLYLHYGDTAATVDPQNVVGVWAGGYEAVFHMEAIADAAGKNPVLGANTTAMVAGRIDLARSFDGGDDYLDVGSATAIDDIFVAGGTAEGWFFADTFGEASYGRIFDKGHEFGWSIFVNNTERANSIGFLHGSGTTSWGFWNTATNTITLNAWHHVALVYNQDSAANVPAFFVDGVLVSSSALDNPPAAMMSDAARVLRAGNRVAGDRTFDGVLDELRLSAAPRSAGWIATQYLNQNDPAGFVMVGPEL